ncbi:hypothetical protein CapIbe_012382 [Capra ibex]
MFTVLMKIRNSWFQAGPPEAPFPGGLQRLCVSSQNGEKTRAFITLRHYPGVELLVTYDSKRSTGCDMLLS